MGFGSVSRMLGRFTAVGVLFTLGLFLVGCGAQEVKSEDVKDWQQQGSDGDIESDPNSDR